MSLRFAFMIGKEKKNSQFGTHSWLTKFSDWSSNVTNEMFTDSRNEAFIS
jgi:hypothetical protein